MIHRRVKILSGFIGLAVLTFAGCVVSKWDEWNAAPDPYGGAGVLTEIRGAKEQGATRLGLAFNGISDVAPLSGLTQLEELYLHENQIADLAPLKRLTKLTELYLHKNKILDLVPLAKLTELRELGLAYNEISEVSSLAGLDNLELLYLGHNSITDLTPLKNLTGLKELWVLNNPIADSQQPMIRRSLPSCEIHFL